ncbi:transposase, partial [Ralstonia solanacearum]
MPRKPYPTDVSDEEWSFAAPYLTLMDTNAPQRVAAPLCSSARLFPPAQPLP